MVTGHTLHLHLTPADRAQHTYYLVPFEVPAGSAALIVRYTWANPLHPDQVNKASGSIIDLGLFDPRGHEFGEGKGFRGWSGSARNEVTLSPQTATPGYLPGPLYPGTWHIVLGLYEMTPEGVDVTVGIETTAGPETEALPAAYVSPGALETQTRWYRGDLHSHTYHSDGTASVETLTVAARAQGLDFVSVTEHNTISHLPDLVRYGSPGLLLIPGIEITTYRGHANVWGVRSWIEFRATDEHEMAHIRDQVRAEGLLFSINHPKVGGPDWMYDSEMDPDAVEGWQAPWRLGNVESLAVWERLLRQGQRLTLVGGSDKHQGPFEGRLGAYEVGTPTTWVWADALSEKAILAGIRAGHVFVSRNPAGPRLSLTAQAGAQAAMMGDELSLSSGARIQFECRVEGAAAGQLLRVLHSAGETECLPITGPTWIHHWEVKARQDDFWRVEVIDPPETPIAQDPTALVAFALSNPIYLSVQSSKPGAVGSQSAVAN